PADGGRDHPARLSSDPGRDPDRVRRLRPHQPGRRRPLRRARSPDPVLSMAVSATDLDRGLELPLGTAGRLARFVRRQPTFVAGALALALMVAAAVAAPVWWTGDPQQMKPVQRLRPPSAERWFGSDHFGRDVYTRTIYGARISLSVGAAVSVLS